MAKGDDKPLPQPGKRRKSPPEGDAPRTGPRLDRYDQVQRDLEIYRAHLRSIDDYDLAATYGLSVETIRDIVRRWQDEGRRITRANPREVIDEITWQLDAAISEIAAVAAREEGSARVSAVIGRINALLQKGKWLQQVGVLPTEARELRVQLDAVSTAETIITVLEKRGILDEDLTREIAAAVGQPIDGEAEEVTDAELVEGDE